MNKKRKEYQKALLVKPINFQKPILTHHTAAECPENNNSEKSDLFHLFDSYFKVSKDTKNQRKIPPNFPKTLRTRLFEDFETQKTKKNGNNKQKFVLGSGKSRKTTSLESCYKKTK
jgi:hypothetical protein